MASTRNSAYPIRLNTADGWQLKAHLYGKVETARATVVVNSALGIKQEYYALFAAWLAEHNCLVLTYNYRGNGCSGAQQLRGLDASITDWGRYDFATAVEYLRKTAPTLPLLCIGHSVGGQLLGLLPNNQRIAGLYAVCSQVGYWGLWSGVERWRAWSLFFVLIPLLTTCFNYFPGSRLGMSDIPTGVAREWARWCRSREYMCDTNDKSTRELFASYRGQALFLSMYDDTVYAPRQTVDALATMHKNANVKRIHIEMSAVNGRAVGHFGFFRTASGLYLWPNVLQWIEQTILHASSNKQFG